MNHTTTPRDNRDDRDNSDDRHQQPQRPQRPGRPGRPRRDVAAETVGPNIARLRAEQDLSRRELAELSGVLRSSLSGYERNEQSPRVDNALRLARALGVSLESLRTGLASPPPPRADLGLLPKKLTLYRTLRGWTQGEMARRCGTHRNVVCDYENGAAMPSFDMACRLADAIGVPVDDLFTSELSLSAG